MIIHSRKEFPMTDLSYRIICTSSLKKEHLDFRFTQLIAIIRKDDIYLILYI